MITDTALIFFAKILLTHKIHLHILSPWKSNVLSK